MALEGGADRRAALRVPQPHRSIIGAAGEQAAIGAERHRHHPSTMDLEPVGFWAAQTRLLQDRSSVAHTAGFAWLRRQASSADTRAWATWARKLARAVWERTSRECCEALALCWQAIPTSCLSRWHYCSAVERNMRSCTGPGIELAQPVQSAPVSRSCMYSGSLASAGMPPWRRIVCTKLSSSHICRSSATSQQSRMFRKYRCSTTDY